MKGMKLLKVPALLMPPIRRLWDSRNSLIAERDALVAERDALIAERDALIAERDALIAERGASIAIRDAFTSRKGEIAYSSKQRVTMEDRAIADIDRDPLFAAIFSASRAYTMTPKETNFRSL
jgi:hypothetical protein